MLLPQDICQPDIAHAMMACFLVSMLVQSAQHHQHRQACSDDLRLSGRQACHREAWQPSESTSRGTVLPLVRKLAIPNTLQPIKSVSGQLQPQCLGIKGNGHLPSEDYLAGGLQAGQTKSKRLEPKALAHRSGRAAAVIANKSHGRFSWVDAQCTEQLRGTHQLAGTDSVSERHAL